MFEWDEDKNIANLKKHGISFEEASLIFERRTYSWVDNRFDYNEERILTVGYIRDVIAVVVVHTDRDGNRRIISARLANRKERAMLNDHYQ